MKKIISIVLVMLLCLSMLVACGDDQTNDKGGENKTTTTVKKPDNVTTKPTASGDNQDPGNSDNPSTLTVEDAKTWLVSTYQDGKATEPMVIKADKEVLTEWMDFTIAWSVTVTEGDANAVKISDASTDNRKIIDIADSNSAAVFFTVTATASDKSGNTGKVDFLFTIPAPVAEKPADSTLTIEEAIALGSSKNHDTYTSGKYYVTGTILDVTNTQYGNFTIKDDKGNVLTIYGSYGADGKAKFTQLNPQPKSGDKVKLYGIIGCYNESAQMKNAWIKELNGKKPAETAAPTRPTVKEPAANSEVSIEDAISIGLSKESGVYTSGKYYVTGEITEVYDDYYGNMYIKDAKGNVLTIYGTYGADGALGYSELTKKPVAGDTVTIYGMIGQFNEKAQIKNGWIVKINGEQQTGTAGKLPNPVTAPVAGTAYKFGMIQENVTAAAIFYITGAKDGFYMATTKDVSKACDVYLEETDGGYYLYTLVGSAKKYINMVVNGTHVNGEFQDKATTVYTYDAANKTLVSHIEAMDKDYRFGTRGDKSYTTVGPVFDGFYCWFYAA